MGSIFTTSITDISKQYNQLISQIMAVERRPVTRLQSQKSDLNILSGVYSDLKNKLSSLKSASATLAGTGTDSIFQTSKTASSSDSDVITASTTSSSAEGVYNFRIKQLATTTTMRSTAELNSSPSIRSSSQVAAGSSNIIDTTKGFSDAGFDNTPDGTVTINGQTFTLSNYSSVDDFMDAINDDGVANANIYYDDSRDQFVIESDDSSDLVISETGTNAFFTEVNIATGTISTNDSGLESDVLLYKTNFDVGLNSTDSGSFKINGEEIEWDADEDTLNEVISRINSSSAGVTAFYDDTNDKVTITSNTTGSEDIEFEDVTGTFLNDTLKFSGVTQTTGQDAKFTINSTNDTDEIVRSSNTFQLNGINFTLNSTNVTNYTDQTYDTVSVERDDEEIQSNINSFITNVNNVLSYIETKSQVDTSSYERGRLSGQTTYTSLVRRINSIILDEITGIDSGKPNTLREIGITFDSNHNLSISDSTEFTNALIDNPDAFEAIFNSTDGVATRIEELLEPYVESSGIIDDTMDSISNRVGRLEDRIDDLNDRLSQKEEQLSKKFNSMFESLVMLRQQYSTVQMFQSAMGLI